MHLSSSCSMYRLTFSRLLAFSAERISLVSINHLSLKIGSFYFPKLLIDKCCHNSHPGFTKPYITQCRNVDRVGFVPLFHVPFFLPASPKRSKHPMNLLTFRPVDRVGFVPLFHIPFSFPASLKKNKKSTLNLRTCRDVCPVHLPRLFHIPFFSLAS